jgi:hypothetical protein
MLDYRDAVVFVLSPVLTLACWALFMWAIDRRQPRRR